MAAVVVMDAEQRRAWEALPISTCPECHCIVHMDDELAHDLWHLECRRTGCQPDEGRLS